MVFQFRKGNSKIHQLDGVTKVVVLFAVSFIAFGNFVGIFQFAILIFSLLMATIFAKISLLEIWRATKWLILTCISFFIIQAYMLEVPGNIPLFNIGNKVIYYEALDYSAAVSIRIYTIFLVSFIFIRTTHPRDLVISFVQILKIPYKIPYAFFIALRIIPLIEKEARCINEAHMVRGIGEKAGFKGKLEKIKRFTVPLLIRSLRDASTMTHSMESRGFGTYPNRNYVETIEMTIEGKFICASFIAIVIVFYTLIFMGKIPFQY